MDCSGFKSDMIFRDCFTCDRTRMALIRTVPASIRTVLGLFAIRIGLVITLPGRSGQIR